MTIRFCTKICLLWQQIIIVLVCCTIKTSALNCSSDPCIYGICLDTPNRNNIIGSIGAYSCYCIDGYTGSNCEINWNDCWSNPCVNGGICNDGIASYNCTCPDGFVGLNCETKYSECMNKPCLNNGTCIDNNGFTCQCPEGYTGDYCEIDASVCNNTICKNFGECIEGPGFSFSCRCREGWTGEFCDEDVDECPSSPCQNGGLCLNVPATYTCACLFGFTGKDCEKSVVACEENPCYNNAMCLFEDDQSVCYCVPDYHGQLCELRYNDCESKNAICENGGTCIDGVNNYTCSCPPPYTGNMCLDVISTTPSIITTTIESFYSPTISSTQSIIEENSTEEIFFEESTIAPKGITSPGPTENWTENQKTGLETSSEATTSYSTTIKDSIEYPSTEKDTNSAFETTTSVFQIPDLSSQISTSSELPFNFSTAKIPIIPANKTVTVFISSSTTTTSNPTSVKITKIPENEKTTEKLITLVTTSFPTAFRDNINVTSNTFPFFPPTTTIYPIVTDRESRKPFSNYSITTTEYPMTTMKSISTKMVSIIPTAYSTVQVTEPQTYSSNCTGNNRNSAECNCTSSDCREPSSIKIAAFNGKSYVRQQVNVDDDGSLKILLQLKTKSKSGIILHTFFDEERYVLLYMEFGQLKFQFSCGLQTMLLGEIDTPINNGRNVDIEIRFRYMVEGLVGKCSAQLFVNETMAMSGEQMLSARENIPRQVRIHLGGIPQAFSHYFPRIALGFVGCMSLLRINGIQRHFIHDSSETFQIEECTSFLCLMNPCRNFGSCHDNDGKVYCKCIAGYTGEMCEKTACDDNPCYLGSTCISSPGTGFICICPLGMHGLRCEEESIIVQPSFSVFIPGFSSYAAYGINSEIRDSMEINMRIMPHSIDQISLIAFMGQSGNSRDISDHFSITYVRGYIMLTWDLGSGTRRIFTKSPISTRAHKPHSLRIGRRGREAWLSVDGIANVTGQAAGTMTQLDVSPILYIGGHKSRNFESLPHDLPLHTGFTGCIFDVELHKNGAVFPVTRSSPATGRGVGECHRNECSHNSCKNGAVCLNHGPTYSCICMKEWEGPECNEPTIRCPSSNPLCHEANI